MNNHRQPLQVEAHTRDKRRSQYILHRRCTIRRQL